MWPSGDFLFHRGLRVCPWGCTARHLFTRRTPFEVTSGEVLQAGVLGWRMVGGILPDTYPKTITMMILRAGFSSGPQIQSDHMFLVPMGAGTCFLPVPERCAGGAGACLFCSARGMGRTNAAPAALDDVSASLRRSFFGGCRPQNSRPILGGFRPPDLPPHPGELPALSMDL